MKKAKKMRCYKRLIHEQSLQVSSLCGTPFLSYLPKRFTQLYRALYGVAMLVHHFSAPPWRPEINKKHLESTFTIKALSFCWRASIRAHKLIS